MKYFILNELAKPLLRRVGTALAALLIAYGADGQLVEQIVAGVSALGLISVDLLFSSKDRK